MRIVKLASSHRFFPTVGRSQAAHPIQTATAMGSRYRDRAYQTSTDAAQATHKAHSANDTSLLTARTFRLSHRSTMTLLLHTRMARSQPNLSRPSPACKQSSSTLVPSFLYARPESSVGISVPGTPPPPISQMTRTRHPNQHCTSTFGARSPATFAPHSTLALVSHSSCLTTAASLPRASACYFSCLLA